MYLIQGPDRQNNEYFSENEVRNPVSVIQGAKNMACPPQIVKNEKT